MIIDYTKPLDDPLLEAAAQVACQFNGSPLSETRRLAIHFSNAAREDLEFAARQVDALRAIGAIPEKK